MLCMDASRERKSENPTESSSIFKVYLSSHCRLIHLKEEENTSQAFVFCLWLSLKRKFVHVQVNQQFSPAQNFRGIRAIKESY